MKNIFSFCMVLGLLSSPGTIAFADDQDKAYELLQRGKIVPLEDIIIDAKKQHGGHVLEVELEEIQGAIYYEIEMLNSGKVWKYTYDASNGKLIKSKKGD